MRSNFELPREHVKDNKDALTISETKVDNSFPFVNLYRSFQKSIFISYYS